MRMLYKYPQARVSLRRSWSRRTAARGTDEPEFELLDTGVFDDDRYFDVVVEYAKAAPDDILMRVTVDNRGPEAATLHVLPQLWFRNTWSWTPSTRRSPLLRPRPDGVRRGDASELRPTATCTSTATPSCCSARTRPIRAGCSAPTGAGLLQGRRSTTTSSTATRDAVNPRATGTKVRRALPARRCRRGGSAVVRLRLRPATRDGRAVRRLRRRVRDAAAPRPTSSTRALQHDIADRRRARWCSARRSPGMLWSKQFYHYRRAASGCDGDPGAAAAAAERAARPQSRLAASQQRRHHLDAGQVGVSVVRRLGSRLPLRRRWR